MTSKFGVLLMVLTTLVSMSCRTGNILSLIKKDEYSETNQLVTGSIPKLVQTISYNSARTIDEEFNHVLVIDVLDSLKSIERRTLDLTFDSVIVKSSYDLFSVWNLEEENCLLTGNIEILDWNADRLLLKEDISIYDSLTRKTLLVQGTREFKVAD